MDPNRLKGKNILITGAARGMGAANAEAFAAQGANVCIGDLDGDEAHALAEKINGAGNGRAVAVKMDVTKREDNAAAVKATAPQARAWALVALVLSLPRSDLPLRSI